MRKRGLSRAVWVVGLCILVILLLSALVYFFNSDIQLSPEEETHLGCVNNTCTVLPGVGPNQCSQSGSFCGCIDTDIIENSNNGLNFFSQGTTRNEHDSETDRCSVSGKLIEYECDDALAVTNLEITCESLGNYTCVAGQCYPEYVTMHQCVDTDGGLSYYIEGQASNGGIRLTDYCLPDGRLAEIYCDAASGEMLVDITRCNALGNYICELGKCVVPI